MARTETQFGPAANGSVNPLAATTYTVLFTVAASHTYNVVLNVCNRSTSTAKARVYVADTDYSTSEPATTTLIAAVCYDRIIGPGEVWSPPYAIVMSAGQKLVVWADTGSALDFLASGVDIS